MAALLELAELEELERLEAEERAQSPVATKKIQFGDVKDREGNLVRHAGEDTVLDKPWQTMLEGVGSGMVRTGRGAVNVANKIANMTPQSVLAKSLGGVAPNQPPDWASDEALRAQDALDKPLTDAGVGAFGQTVGQVAATLPMGGVARAPAAARAALPLVARTLTSPAARSALEGAVSSATVADPDKQVSDAALGAGLGAGMTKAGQALKRTVGGLAKTGQAAEHLEQFAEQHGKDVFIPAAQAIGDDADVPSKLVKTLYKEILPLVPLASGQIKSQSKRLGADIRGMALKEADFKGVLTADDLASPEQAIPKLQKALDDEYLDTVKAYSFRVPPDFRDKAKARIKAASPEVDDVTLNKVATMVDEKLNRYASNKASIVGENLLHAKNAISDEIRGMRGAEKQAGIAAIKSIEDMIEHRLTLGNSPVMKKDLARYKALNEPYSAFVAVRDAAKKAVVNKGEFTPGQLVRSAKKSPIQKLLGQTAHEVTSQSVGTPSPAGRVAAYSALGALGGFGSLPAAGGVVGLGNALATESAQDIFLGRTRPQQALIQALRDNPKKMRYFGTAGRAAATSNVGDE
jgi:hypothetical protein